MARLRDDVEGGGEGFLVKQGVCGGEDTREKYLTIHRIALIP